VNVELKFNILNVPITCLFSYEYFSYEFIQNIKLESKIMSQFLCLLLLLDLRLKKGDRQIPFDVDEAMI
jgi:hypothetical protein